MTGTAIESFSYGWDWLLLRSTEILTQRHRLRFRIHRTPSFEIRATKGQSSFVARTQSAILEVILHGELQLPRIERSADNAEPG